MVATRSNNTHAKADGAHGDAAAGEKHVIDNQDNGASPDAKRVKRDEADDEKQTTIEESFAKSGESKPTTTTDESRHNEADKQTKNDNDTEMGDSKDADSDNKVDAKPTSKSDTAEKPHEDPDVPSSILEKGLIYFFIRARVNIDEPEQVNDIARSYFILRPLARDARLGEGPIGDAGNSRLLALPKKVLPQSGKDRFMVFVEKSGASFKELKETFLQGAENVTKTQGTSTTPPATPVAEGVYVITSTGRDSHLAYMITLPGELGEVQKDLGVKEQGSFIVSTKNPEQPSPANTQLPEGPGFSKEIQDEFQGRRWLPSKPAHFDYPNAQILLIGESSGIEKAVEPQQKDQKNGKEEAEEVLKDLEDDDVDRMKHLGDSDSEAIFKDLRASADDYPKLMTTF
ncbi:hypothetical protein HYQ44_018342 [Verticillium longisporum]|nr:hypothetical protein HYQ44_018342 [Verticillium longisporum]